MDAAGYAVLETADLYARAGASSGSSEERPPVYKVVGIVLAVSSGLFIGVSFVVKKIGLLKANVKYDEEAGEGYGYLKNGWWWTGMILMIIGEVCNFAAYMFVDAILVTPLGALSVVVTTILSAIFLKERLSFVGKMSCVLAILGSVIIALNAPEQSAVSDIQSMQHYVISPGFLTYTGIIIVGCAFVALWVAPRYGKKTMMVYLTICSLIGGLSVVATQGLGAAIIAQINGKAQFNQWFTYVLLVFVILTLLTEIIYLNKALNLYNAALVTPTYYVYFTSATIVASAVLFRGFKGTAISITTVVMGFLVICVGVVLLQLAKSSKDVPETAVFKGEFDEVRTIAEQKEPEYEPRADTIRGGGAIVRALSRTRTKRQAEEAQRIHEERMQPIGENETVEWDGLHRRKTTSTAPGSIKRSNTVHPPLGMSHMPDDDSEPEEDMHPGFFSRLGRKLTTDGDFCLVDLDDDTIESTDPPTCLPRPQRRKLQALLQAAAPHHNKYGVPTGPPVYAVETYPYDAFSSENPQVFDSRATRSTLATLVSESSANFGDAPPTPQSRTSVYNAFVTARGDNSRGSDRPSTSSTTTNNSHSSGASPPSPVAPSPINSSFSNGASSRNDSGFALQATLREKRSGHFADGMGRRNSSFGFDRIGTIRRPSQPSIVGHQASMSTSNLSNGPTTTNSTYAPSVYAQSTLAASTVMPHMMVQPVRDNELTKWVEGHCFIRRNRDGKSICAVCDERCEDESFRCNACTTTVHSRCIPAVCLVCPSAFRADQVHAAFVRCFASLFYTYRKYLHPASGESRKAGLIYHFNMDAFLKSVPHGDSEYMHMLRQTQMFNEFIHEREATRAEDPSIKLFDEIILSKRNRGRSSLSLFSSKSSTSFLSDTSDHLWRSAAATPPSARFPTDTGVATGRTPAKLDPSLMKEPRSIQGAPRPNQARTKRKPVASMLGLSSQTADP